MSQSVSQKSILICSKSIQYLQKMRGLLHIRRSPLCLPTERCKECRQIQAATFSLFSDEASLCLAMYASVASAISPERLAFWLAA